jgi:hypothetical protein
MKEREMCKDDEEFVDNELYTSVDKLSKDLRVAALSLSDKEARFLVDSYYSIQANRIRNDSQVRSILTPLNPDVLPEPCELLEWTARQNRKLEVQLKAALDVYSDSKAIGRWARQVIGIGPVLAAGLIAHIDIKKAVSSSDVWSFGGYNPEAVWKEGEKRPWNADLKVLFWKIGKSFVLVSGNAKSAYGRIYRERKEYEIRRNESGGNAETAAKILSSKRWKDKDVIATLKQGKLPKGQIDARARRVAVKVFLSHFHAKWRALEGLSVPVPFAQAHMGHVHNIEPEVL